MDSLTRLAQHLNGLRSGVRIQFDLTKSAAQSRRTSKGDMGDLEQLSTSVKGKQTEADGKFSSEEGQERLLSQTAGAMFGELVDDLGPPLKALTVRLNCATR